MYGAALLLLLSLVTLSNSQFIGLRGRAYVFFAQPDVTQPFRVSGILDFEQDIFNLRINGTLNGLTAGNHGFHVHARGDIGNGCLASAGHFNPLGMTHGGPGQLFPTVRHIGDLGNIVASNAGVATINQTFRGLGLFGPFTILGRAILVHAQQDDLGRGGNAGSLATGNAGGRVACGIIGRL